MGSRFRIAAVAAVMLAAAGAASAQSFPSKAVHIFVPYPAGGGVDVLARTLGDVVQNNGDSRSWSKTGRAPAG
jgi:tripartite-type tricarboxylate transporter receptor subunit TctC